MGGNVHFNKSAMLVKNEHLNLQSFQSFINLKSGKTKPLENY